MANDNKNCAVKIAVRERPIRESMTAHMEPSVVSYHSCSNVLIVGEKPFTFDNILGPDVSQSHVFDHLIKPLVVLFKQGFNCTALAYGQTGTGKSYTMGLDSINFEAEHIGVIPRILKDIFSDENASQDVTPSVRELSASFIEIYNEKVYDLLANNTSEPIMTKGCRYTGGSKKKLECLEDCYKILTQGSKNRHVRPTNMNSQSSRSHAVFTIHLRQTSSQISGEETIFYSCMNVVDLAGSEGVRRTGHQGVAMSEGVNINQGLLSIGKVLQAMTIGSKLIPFRDSVLSSVLQDSLNANSYLTLLACISPHREDLSETLSTLRFAQNAKQLKNTPQIVNIMAEKNKKHKQTPCKVKPLLSKNTYQASSFKRPVMGSESRKTAVKYNTFCTPKKQRIEDNKCNQTDIVQSHQRQKLSNFGMNLPRMDLLNSTKNRESVCNRSLDLNASLSSLNISTSTAVDCAENKNYSKNNFSPIIRKCFTELENGLEKKFLEILQRNMPSFMAPQTPGLVTSSQCASQSIMRSELKSIVKEILLESPATISTSHQHTAKCELFPSNPEFKIPAVPAEVICPKTSSPKNLKDNDLSLTEIFFNSFSPTHKRTFNDSVRRSRRISQRHGTEKQIDLHNLPLNNERSTCKATPRRSMRLTLGQKVNQHTSCYSPLPNKKIAPQNKKKNNSIIENCYSGTSLTKHRKAVLDLLNNGNRKEVQILPLIGQKKAFQIVTHRTLNGKFKTLAQVGKLPFWRGSEWTRFATANFLL